MSHSLNNENYCMSMSCGHIFLPFRSICKMAYYDLNLVKLVFQLQPAPVRTDIFLWNLLGLGSLRCGSAVSSMNVLPLQKTWILFPVVFKHPHHMAHNYLKFQLLGTPTPPSGIHGHLHYMHTCTHAHTHIIKNCSAILLLSQPHLCILINNAIPHP